MKPKLRADVRYVPSDEGVQVFSGAGSFALTGASLHPLLDQLAGKLDGTRSVESIVDGLPARHRRVVTKLIDILVARRAAYDAEAELPHGLQAWELARYSQEVAFAELASGSGAHWFERFRHAKVLLVGAGSTLAALVRAMLQLGARGGSLLAVDDLPGAADRRRASLTAFTRDDPLLALAELPDPGGWGSFAQVRSRLAGYDAVLHCDDRPVLGRAAMLNRAARAAGLPSLQAVLVAGGTGWVGPAAAGGDDLGCWECAWRFLRGARSESDPHWPDLQLRDAAPRPAPEASEPISGLVGAMLAMAYFRLVTEGGAAAAGHNRMVRVDLATGTAREHRFARHPGCRACPPSARPTRSTFTRALAAARDSPARTDADLSRAATGLRDPALGTILSFDEGDRRQLPLVVTVATVNDLTGSGTGPRTVFAAGADHAQARRRVVVHAIETAAALAVAASPAAPPAWAWEVVTDKVVPAPASSPGWAGDVVSGTVVPAPALPPGRAREGASGTVVSVPAAGPGWAGEVASAFAGPGARTTAAGYCWAEAVGRGLLRHHARLAAAGTGRPMPVPSSDRAGQLVDAAGVLGADLRLTDLTEAAAGVPVVAVSGPDGRVVAAALDLPGALVTALEGAVARLQGSLVRGEIGADLGDERWPDRLGWLAERLAAQGWRALARPVALVPGPAAATPLLAEVSVVPA